MKRLLRAGCLLVLFALTNGACGVSTNTGPKAVKATYGAYMNGMAIGAIMEQFEADGGTYRTVSETRTPAPLSSRTAWATELCWPATSRPPSVVRSSRRSGTKHAACGL